MIETRRHVHDAVARRELPPGGPSELAALDLLDEAPSPHWERWSADTADRARAHAKAVRCCCADGGTGPVSEADARCSRCWDSPEGVLPSDVT